MKKNFIFEEKTNLACWLHSQTRNPIGGVSIDNKWDFPTG
jgi:hypothetical protein